MDRLRDEHPDRYDGIRGDVIAHDEQLPGPAGCASRTTTDRRRPAGQVLRFVLREGSPAVVMGPWRLPCRWGRDVGPWEPALTINPTEAGR